MWPSVRSFVLRCAIINSLSREANCIAIEMAGINHNGGMEICVCVLGWSMTVSLTAHQLHFSFMPMRLVSTFSRNIFNKVREKMELIHCIGIACSMMCRDFNDATVEDDDFEWE